MFQTNPQLRIGRERRKLVDRSIDPDREEPVVVREGPIGYLGLIEESGRDKDETHVEDERRIKRVRPL